MINCVWNFGDPKCLLFPHVQYLETSTWTLEGMDLCGSRSVTEDQGYGPQAGMHPPLLWDPRERVLRGTWPGFCSLGTQHPHGRCPWGAVSSQLS